MNARQRRKRRRDRARRTQLFAACMTAMGLPMAAAASGTIAGQRCMGADDPEHDPRPCCDCGRTCRRTGRSKQGLYAL